MDKKLLRWNFIFQYGWVLTNMLSALLLLPLYLKNIDKDTLGVWLATGSVLGWMTLVDPGIGDVLQQRIAHLNGQGDQAEVGRTIASGYMACALVFLAAILVGGLCMALAGTIVDKDLSQHANLPAALAITVAATGFTLVSYGTMGMNQGLHNTVQVTFCSLTGNVLFLAINVLLLFRGWGVLSIALANLCRALYLNVYNVIALLIHTKKMGKGFISFQKSHFKKFIHIFSFTSASKIIAGISHSIDMVVLARYIAPSAIAVFEINKRPVGICYALIGRHSVAMMPLISHAAGRNDRSSIQQLVDKQFRIYSYAALFTCLLILYNYDWLIGLWAGSENFAGFTILNLMAAGLFCGLISYFMAIVGYALGDIKMNSMYNIVRNVFFGIAMFAAARWYGIVGTLWVSMLMSLVFDFAFYCWRLHKLGYLPAGFFQRHFSHWLYLLPLLFGGAICLRALTGMWVPEAMLLIRAVTNSILFSLLFAVLVLWLDKRMMKKAKWLGNTYLMLPLQKLRRA